MGGLVILMMMWLVALPFSAWRHTVLRHHGLSTQDWGGWAADLFKGYAVGAVIGAVVLGGFYTLTQFAPGWWWAFGAVGAAALVVLLSFVFPVLVEPVFNKFTPMPAGPLRDELLMMAVRDGMPVREVLVADASRRTTGLNAYVSGLDAPGGSWSTTRCCARRLQVRCAVSSRTSWATPRTGTPNGPRCWGRSGPRRRSWRSTCWENGAHCSAEPG